MEKKDILIIISLFFTAFLIRVGGVSNVYIYSDEWLYWIDTNNIIASNWEPTAKVFDYSPPFLQHICAVVTLFFGGDLNTLRMISVIFGSLTVPMLYLFGNAMYDRKTGIISAILLCFSAFHCLYSRTIMLDVFTLFFVTAFLYFFWLSQCSEHARKNMVYAIIAGAMLGLAFDAKYISLFLVIMAPTFVLWIRKFSFKALMDKRLILTFVSAFLLFLPLLICLIYTEVYFHGIFYYGIERFEKDTAGGNRLLEFGLNDILVTVVESLTSVFAWGAEILTPAGGAFFKLSAILLIGITFLFYLPKLINKEREGSFLIISIFSLYVLLLGCASYRHYHIYSLVFYFVMIAHIAVKSFEYIKIENGYKNILRIFIIALTAIMIFLYFVTGITSPYWDDGEYSEIKIAMDYIKNDVAKSGHRVDTVIGVNFRKDEADYYMHLNDLNSISTIRIVKLTTKYESGERKIDLEKIDMLNPDYLIIIDDDPRYYLKGKIEDDILKYYKIVSRSKSYFFECIILKKDDPCPREILLTAGEGGTISRDIFKESVPKTMKIGKIYTALARVENTGDYRTNFTVRVVSDVPNKFILFVEDGLREVTLDKGSTYLFKIKIVPFRKYGKELPVTVELYTKSEENETRIKKVDSVSDYVHYIK